MKRKGDKKKNSDEEESVFAYLQKETVQGIIAILFFVFGIFLVLSKFGKAGPAGKMMYEFFLYLFGLVGYWIVPSLFFILCISFFNSLKKRLALTHTIGGLLFFLSSLSLLHIFTKNGGVVGEIISSPLLKLFDLYASVIILLTLMIISFLVMFDIPIKINLLNLFRRKILVEESDNNLILSPATVEALRNTPPDITQEGDQIHSNNNNIERKEFDFNLGKITLSGKEFIPPPLSLLEKDHGKPGVGDIKANSNIIKRT